MDVAGRFSAEIEAFFGSGRCFLLAKGRVGLYAGLRAMGLPRGSKVLIPGYTCVVVPAAARYAGLEPVYVDIDPSSYNLDVRLLDRMDEVAAVIVQHTYGIPCDMAAVRAWAERRRAAVIEDCCHALGSKVDGRLCGTFGEFAFLSGQWNKPFSTGLGGMILVHESRLAQRVATLLAKELRPPGGLRAAVLALQLLVHRLAVTPRTTGRITRLYRLLGSLGLAIGSSSPRELEGEMPRGYFSGMARCQARNGLREIAAIEENMDHRRRLAQLYRRRLPEMGFDPGSFPADLPLLRYPLRVANKDEVLAQAEREGMEIGSWFESPLHPEGTPVENFGYRPGMCPMAERACQEVVNLPTHLGITDRICERILDFLRRRAAPAAQAQRTAA